MNRNERHPVKFNTNFGNHDRCWRAIAGSGPTGCARNSQTTVRSRTSARAGVWPIRQPGAAVYDLGAAGPQTSEQPPVRVVPRRLTSVKGDHRRKQRVRDLANYGYCESTGLSKRFGVTGADRVPAGRSPRCQPNPRGGVSRRSCSKRPARPSLVHLPSHD